MLKIKKINHLEAINLLAKMPPIQPKKWSNKPLNLVMTKKIP